MIEKNVLDDGFGNMSIVGRRWIAGRDPIFISNKSPKKYVHGKNIKSYRAYRRYCLYIHPIYEMKKIFGEPQK